MTHPVQWYAPGESIFFPCDQDWFNVFHVSPVGAEYALGVTVECYARSVWDPGGLRSVAVSEAEQAACRVLPLLSGIQGHVMAINLEVDGTAIWSVIEEGDQ